MSESPSFSRSKRQKIDKHGRFAALERLKNLKGTKNKYEVSEIENVYEEVSEKEYSERVLSRAADDWIEDDGTGYVEDGREIFDDEDVDAEHEETKKREKANKKESKKRLRDVNKPVDGNSSIRSMFGNVVAKKKETKVNLDDDDILASVLGEIDPENSKSNENRTATESKSFVATTNLNKKTEMAMVKDYMANLSKAVPRKKEVKADSTSDDEMLERLMKPGTKNQSSTRQSLKRPRDDNSPAASKPVIDSTPAKPRVESNVIEKNNPLKPGPETPSVPEPVNDMDISGFHDDDMDFSMLDDEENQFDDTAISKEKIAKAEQIKADLMKKESENYAKLLSNWENPNEDDDDDALLGSIDVDAAQISIASTVDGKSTMKFWYWDAYEDTIKFPGKIYLFGKMVSNQNPKEYKSVCITVENVDRCLYLLPREYTLDPITKQSTSTKVNFLEVYTEFRDYLKQDFKSRKTEKHFAFSVPGVNVPKTSDYLEVLYNAKHPAPDPKKMFTHIEHVFGINTNPLETFLLQRKIKGPCWLNISNYELAKVQTSTWCNLAITCNPSSISVATDVKASAPPLVVATVYVRTALHPKTQTNEIIMIACLVNNKFPVDKKPPNPPYTRHFCGFTRPSSQNWPMIGMNEATAKFKNLKATKLDSERALLSWFLATFKNLDADLIVTHDASDCQLDVICDRLQALKMPMWSRIGRLNLSTMPKRFMSGFVGRMICDVKSSAEELIKSRSYDLNTLCENVLKLKEGERSELSNDELHEKYESVEGISNLITLTLQDCSYVLRIMCELNVIPLALQITNICGNLMSRTLQGGRSERNEYLLLHAFDEKGYIVPDKKIREWNKDETFDLSIAATQGQNYTAAPTQSARKKPAYVGGLVLEPIKGFYDKFILLMDFNSLYPSIIQEYNICFTTVDQPEHEDDPIVIPDTSLPPGILPCQIRSLVDRRRGVKKLIVPGIDPDLKAQYNIRQLALKLTANSMYGCLGFTNSRFYAKHLAALVTQKGRDILLNTKGIVTNLNFDVIYGDTDSIMINSHSTDYDEVFKLGHRIKQAVNKTYRQIELDIDGVYKYMLLLAKKKYAAVTITKTKSGELEYNQELKGLDIVRRDWSQISVMAGKVVLNEILSDTPLDERIGNINTRLEKIRNDINNDDIPLNLLTITKQLTKNPREYQKIQSMPHVQVALRMNATKNKRYKRGDMVSYVICEDGTDNNPMQRGYHLDELKTESKLKIDKEYYLANQIHPVVSRLLKPIEGTDSARIAECLGLDPSKYREAAQRVTYENERESVGESIIQSNAAKYRSCEKFTYKCASCKTDNVIVKPFVKIDGEFKPVLSACENKECRVNPVEQLTNIKYHLSLAIRKSIRNYYDNWMTCNDPNCNHSTRTYVHVTDRKGHPICLACKRGHLIKCYSEGDLYQQLRYFQFMFELPKYEQSLLRVSKDIEDAFQSLREHVEVTIKRSGYHNIKLSELFQKLTPT